VDAVTAQQLEVASLEASGRVMKKRLELHAAALKQIGTETPATPCDAITPGLQWPL